MARALPDGSTLMAPVSALQGARRTGYASRAAHVHQVCCCAYVCVCVLVCACVLVLDYGVCQQGGARLLGVLLCVRSCVCVYVCVFIWYASRVAHVHQT